MKVVAIVQARLGSTRLPGKVLKDIEEKPMLWHVFHRLQSAQEVDELALATTTSPQDDQLEQFAQGLGLACFRGEEEDVLSRYLGAAVEFKADIIVRVTSDCPLIDPLIVDSIIKGHLDSNADYTSNTLKRTYPRGLDTEVLSFRTLERAYKEASKQYEREHVTPYIWQHPELFKLHNVEAEGKLRRPDLRLTVDTEEDLELICEIYKQLYQDNNLFTIEQVIDLLDQHPGLALINAHVQQKRLGER